MSQFLGKPTRGGKLTMLNCALWLLLACVARFAPGPLMILFVIVPLISLPGIACGFVLPKMGGVDRIPLAFMILAGIMTGVNAHAWGYGLSWLISRVATSRHRRLLRVTRGQELVPYPRDNGADAKWG